MHQYVDSPPPPWSAFSTYQPGMVVWYLGTFWRCEAGHTSGKHPIGAPSSNFHLWTPVSSSGPYPLQYPTMPPPQFAPPTHPEILSPVPLPMPARPPSPGRSSSSPETVIYEDTGDSRLRFFQAKAADSMRYIVQREETTKERDEKELRQELKGKRVWRVGGIGIWAYSQDSALEEKKRQIWREENGKGDWLSSARARTKLYTESRGVKPPVMWKLVEGSDIPRDALPIGQEADGAPLYSARAWHEGGLHLGKAGPHLFSHANISYGAAEHAPTAYEVLCVSDPDSVKWMTFRHGEKATVEQWQPVEGGRESNGAALLVAKGEYENGTHPGSERTPSNPADTQNASLMTTTPASATVAVNFGSDPSRSSHIQVHQDDKHNHESENTCTVHSTHRSTVDPYIPIIDAHMSYIMHHRLRSHQRTWLRMRLLNSVPLSIKGIMSPLSSGGTNATDSSDSRHPSASSSCHSSFTRDMACTPLPSVTLWGTTQITSTTQITTTSLSLFPGAPSPSPSTSFTVSCDVLGNCITSTITNLVTVIPTITSTITTQVDATTVLTSIVPRQTLYSPCPDESESSSVVGMDAETFSSASPVSQSSNTSSHGPGFTPSTSTSVTRSSSPSTSSSGSSSSASPRISKPTTSSITSILSMGSEIMPSQSMISSTTTSASATTSATVIAASSASNTSHSHGAVIAGSVIGSLVTLVVLLFLLIRLRRSRPSDRYDRAHDDKDEYWESRFRELEAEAETPGEKGDASREESRRLHVSRVVHSLADEQLTLDLGSKALPTRPASRLSTISAFFKPAPEPFRAPTTTKGKLNFSRPLRPLRRASEAPSKSRASASTRSARTPAVEERTGMEWMRGSGETQVEGESVMENAVPTSIFRRESTTSANHQLPSIVRFPSELISLPDPVEDSSISHSGSLESSSSSTGTTLGSPHHLTQRRLCPPVGSIRHRRESIGRHIPSLHLSREAITPSLWVDDELYARFHDMSGASPDGAYGGTEAVTTEHGQVEEMEKSAVTPQLPTVQVGD